MAGIDLKEAVLTTSFVLNKEDQIINVYHHLDDGMWEFVGEMEAEESDYRVVSIEEMVDLDDSILSLLDMERGYFACRMPGKDNFLIEKMLSDS